MISKKWPEAEKISLLHIQKAAKNWTQDPSKYSFGKSRLYDVWIDGKPYPPKAIGAIAYNLATKKVLVATDFLGKKGGFWQQLLIQRGFEIRPKNSKAPPFDLEKNEREHLKAVQKSLKDTPAARAMRLASAPKRPLKNAVTTFVFSRNPDVVAEMLFRANGVCQGCFKKAPFSRKSDGTPFLEVHHKLPLAKNGEDTIENAIALCPNCHRKMHFGRDLEYSGIHLKVPS